MVPTYTSYNRRIVSNPYIAGSFACIGGLLTGLSITSMSGVLNNEAYLSTFNFPNPSVQGAIVAAMPAGATLGSLAATQLADRMGRKKTVIIAGIIWVIGSVIQCAAIVTSANSMYAFDTNLQKNRAMLVLGRIISGTCVGLTSSVIPIYLSETAPPAIRGRMISLLQWSITWGIAMQYFIQFGCSYILGVASFRIPWGLQMIPAVILIFGMLFFPETPRWLCDHGYDEEALQVLADLHAMGNTIDPTVIIEYEQIREQVHYEHAEGVKSYLDLFRHGNPRRAVLGMSLHMWGQLSGVNVMNYYIVYVFQGAGLTGRRSNLIADSVQYALQVLLTIPSILYIDRWGRRPMLLFGTLCMGFFLFIVGGIQGRFGHWVPQTNHAQVWIIEGHGAAGRAVIVASYLFICSYSAAIGPIVWTYPAELYSLKIRGKAVSIATATNWAFNTALAFGVPPALNTIAWKTYFIFGTFNFCAFIHFFFMFPETVGRSLEEIEDIFKQGHTFSAWKITRRLGEIGLSRDAEDISSEKSKE